MSLLSFPKQSSPGSEFLNGRKRTELIVKQVEEWKTKNGSLTAVDLVISFIEAIQAIRKRTLLTLSNVTVCAVIDRTLFECKEKYPILTEITNNSEGLNFEKFQNQIHDSSLADRQNALQELLIELLEVFGKITADILTKYLIQELMTVNLESIQKNSNAQTVRKLSSIKNRDQK